MKQAGVQADALAQSGPYPVIRWSRSNDLGIVCLCSGKFGHVHNSRRDLPCVSDCGWSIRLGICLGTRGLQTGTCLDCWLDDCGKWDVYRSKPPSLMK
jgi:hypothetical protein